METSEEKKLINRRAFLRNLGRIGCGLALGGVATRVVTAHLNPETAGPKTRFMWQINPDKCTQCGKCEIACVRTPSAVKAVNDQKKCSYCVVCFGHIKNKHIDSDKIMSDGIRVCPKDAIIRKNYSGGNTGYFLYDIDHNKCIGCGKCVKECEIHGTKSMFLIIRPDLCMNCNSCNIQAKCEAGAIEKLYYGPEDNFKGIYELEGMGDSGDYMM